MISARGVEVKSADLRRGAPRYHSRMRPRSGQVPCPAEPVVSAHGGGITRSGDAWGRCLREWRHEQDQARRTDARTGASSVAIAEFALKGYCGTSAEAIARRVGVTQP